jgi:ankyrin repeat protein
MENELLIEAGTIEEARNKAKARLVKGFKISSEKTVNFGLPVTVECEDLTTDKAFSELQKQIPIDASIICRKELRPAREQIIDITASNKEDALFLVKNKIGEHENIKEIRLARQGSTGFWGLGHKNNLYHSVILGKALVSITYQMKAACLFTFTKKNLMDAVSDGDSVEEIKTFLDSGFAVDMRDDQRQTPLMLASWKGRLEAAKFLISNKADVNACDEGGNTPLMLSLNEEIVKLLISNGADVNASNSWGASALCNAAKKGNDLIVKLLLDHGANMDHREFDGYTPLIRAAMNGHDRVVDVLLSQGADTHLKTKDGHTALTLAIENRHARIAQLLQKTG